MTDSSAFRSDVRAASRQKQFLNVVSRDEATQRFQSHLHLQSLGSEFVSLADARGRVLAEDFQAQIDVPGFDRSNVDGFAVIAGDTIGAMEESPVSLQINNESLLPGQPPTIEVLPGTATPISTGGVLPRGANAVVMIEDTNLTEENGQPVLEITRSVPPGNMITFAGSDIARGETVLWVGTQLTSRELGVLASLGQTDVSVHRQPRVAILSTGDEVVAPGEELPLGSVYDSNAAILSAAVEECSGEPVFLGRVKDDAEQLHEIMKQALEYDVVLLSGGTSKGAGDLSYQVVEQLTDPGIVAHGVALKPGKPICLAVTAGKPVVILPGFPTSAIFTFHEFVAPVIRMLAGQSQLQQRKVSARLPYKINSGRGRTEYVLVRLFTAQDKTYAYPMGKGSGSVTTYSLADGFISIPQHSEIVDAGSEVEVALLDAELKTTDFVVIGSHCIGLDAILGQINASGTTTSVMHIGSEAGLLAVQRGECHLAGIHLLDPESGKYNIPFMTDELILLRGYRRMQSFLCRANDARFQGLDAEAAIQTAVGFSDCVMVNRNPGSGTRILTDQTLRKLNCFDQLPSGYGTAVKSHNAVAAAITQQRADWGIGIDAIANQYGLYSIPLKEECFDFVIRRENRELPQIKSFQSALRSQQLQDRLRQIGFGIDRDPIGLPVR